MLFRETSDAYCEKHANTLRGQNAEFQYSYVKAGV
jgi:hypothetical protein